MKKIYLFLFVLSLFVNGNVFSQCTETNETKVLMVGDSWSFFMHLDGTFNSVFKSWGFSNYKYLSNYTVSENGAQTDDFMGGAKQTEIKNLLDANPSIEVVHLSIGGNDLLGSWKVSSTPGQIDTMENEVFDRLDSVMRFIKSCRPGIRIVWSGYVYPNFEEVISTFPAGATNHFFYGKWRDMEFPTFIQINSLLNRVSARMETYAANDPQVDFVKCTGVLQYIYGQTTALAVAPGGTYQPYSVALPLGDPNYPSPKSTMRNQGIGLDCYHLSPQAYRDFINYQTQKFYHKFLMDDMYVLSENNAQTGSVSNTGTVSDTLFIGGNANEQFATVLSFNTTAMADTTLAKASLFLRRASLSGTNPINGTMQVQVKSGNLGATANVEAADFTATGDASATPCLFGSTSTDNEWIRLDLPSQLYPYINKNAATQFIISSPGATAGKTTFYNSSNPDFAPVLNLKYTRTTGIKEATPTVKFNVYPNPTNGKLTIEKEGETIKHIEVTNLLGEVVLQPKLQDNTIDISHLANGMYILNITTQNGRAAQRVFKN